MKNVFFTLAFMLVGTFAFANNLENHDYKEKTEVIKKNEKKSLEYNEIVKTILNEDFTCTEYHFVYYDGVLVAEFEIEKESDCVGTLHFLKSDD